MKFTPINGKILLKQEEMNSTTASGLLIAFKEDKQDIAMVVRSDCEEIVEGQKVCFAKYAPDEITIDDTEYLIADLDDILAIIND